jgi:hypothetical protein
MFSTEYTPCPLCKLFHVPPPKLASLQWQLISGFSCTKEYFNISLHATLHNFSNGVPCTILIVLAQIQQHKKMYQMRQTESIFHREIMENIELQLRLRNSLWKLWETLFTPVRKVSYDMGQYGWNINYP